MMKNLLLPITCAIVLSGCVKSQIAVFHDLPQNFTGTSYIIIPLPEQEGSLEHKQYEKILKQELNAKGFYEAPLEGAEVIVTMFYGIDSGREVIDSFPIIGQTGVTSSQTYGRIQSSGNYGTYSGTTTYTPSYGIVGMGTSSSTEFMRFLKIDIVEKKALTEGKIKKLYEARVISSGRSGQLPKVFPSMIKALFNDFPGESGRSRTVTLPLE